MNGSKGDLQLASFWEHLDELRGAIIRAGLVALVAVVLAFAFKDVLFSLVLAPSRYDFLSYRLLGIQASDIHLINTGLTEQFMTHMRVACYAGLLLSLPYVIYELFRFVSPALYQRERRYAGRLVGSAYAMFMVGTLVNYFIIFPLTVHFLGTYRVSTEVQNMLTLQSYAETLLSMSLIFGLVFELPVLSWILALAGLLKPDWMRQYRRHAVVVILLIAAVITPTTDVFTLLFVSLPIWWLYEASILIVKMTRR